MVIPLSLVLPSVPMLELCAAIADRHSQLVQAGDAQG